jgi:hypothetical protein
VTGDDCWELTCAVTGDPEQATDRLFTSGVVAMINALREERDHLVNQLKAAEKHVEVMAAKKSYAASPWLHQDIQTLRRLLALRLPGLLEELRRLRSEGE